MRRGRLIIPLVTFLILAGTSPMLAAETLKEMGESDMMTRFDRESEVLKNKSRHIEKWAEPDSNYAAIFDKNTFGKEILGWLGGSFPGYTRGEDERRRNDELVRVWTDFRLRAKSQVFILSIFVPFPRTMPAASMGLMKELSVLEPPSLAVEKQEDVTIRGVPAKLYKRSDSGFSLLFKLDKETRVNIECSKCESPEEITTFARMLDIGRLNRKLNS